MENIGIIESLSVLYVEDDDFMRESIGRFLKRRVGELRLAANGAEGLSYVLEDKPQLIITDIKMPKMDGIEMIHEIRKEYSKEDLPIVVVSAYNDDEHHTDEADIYVNKPIAISDLYDVIKKLAYEHNEGKSV